MAEFLITGIALLFVGMLALFFLLITIAGLGMIGFVILSPFALLYRFFNPPD